MTERKSLLDQALDLCLYAPVGLAISVTEELPQLIDKGRARVNSQLTMAKMVGGFAVAQGQREAQRVVRQATGQATGRVPGSFGSQPPREAGPSTPPGGDTGDLDATPWATAAGGPEPTDGDGTGTTSMADSSAQSDGATEVMSSTTPAASAADPSALAIPGYDALSASQVVQRLAGLAADELEAVRTYEAATRGRRTILNRIAQLQGPGRS